MSVVDNIASHNDELEREVANMQDLMAKTQTGIVMLEKSQEMAMSEEMMELMAMIGDPEYPEEERMTLAQYMGDMLQQDPENGLLSYAQYLEGVLKDPQYESRTEYYSSIAEAAKALNDATVYKEYIEAFTAFEADKSAEAEAARIATKEMQEKMRKWANG